jgi:hypothetical protein
MAIYIVLSVVTMLVLSASEPAGPSSGAPISSTPIGTHSSVQPSATSAGTAGPAQTLLVDLPTVAPDALNYKVDADVLDGVSYPRAWIVSTCNIHLIDVVTSFNLARQYQRFTAIAGPSDNASVRKNLSIVVRGDDRTLFSGVATIGHPVHIDVAIAGVLRLELIVKRGSDTSGICTSGPVVFADAALT